MSVPRKPDLILKVMRKDTDRKSGRLGAAWTNEDGSVSIDLDPGVCLEYHPDLVITLFPAEKRNA